jgi:MFS family permease
VTANNVKLGLRENWAQFWLLVLVNAFVGGVVGLERSILPAIAQQDFGMMAHAAILSFIVAFGLTKAATNYLAGRLADRFGRKRTFSSRAGWLRFRFRSCSCMRLTGTGSSPPTSCLE